MSQANPDVSSERELKQDYLKVQIIDKGFDPDKFSEFVCALKTGNFTC